MRAPLSARAALLQVLTVPGYGLDLIERVRRASGGRLRLRMGSVYPALLSLERAGLVRRRSSGDRQRGRPRRYYELTMSGVREATEQREALRNLLRAPAAEPVGDSVGLMRERLERCSALSAAVLMLQRGIRNAKRTR